jgi:2-desacetyl-2-hydroxyethyl bacteriochlorophyllide A dehydrogenase
MDARVGNNRVIGHEMSGTVDAIGEGVTSLSQGEPVVIRPLVSCGECPACRRGHAHICQNLKFLGLDTDGAFQEYWTVPASTVHKLPEGLPLEHAALIEPLAVACHDVRLSRLQAGEDVLVIGGGPIGMLLSMVAREQGGKVVLSEVNPHRLAIAAKLGFETLDPRETDVPAAIHELTGDKGADVIFEVSGSQAGVDVMTASAATRGRIVMVAIHANRPQIDLFRFFWREIEMLGARVYEPEDFEAAIRMIRDGVIDCETMITDVQDLEQIGTAFATLSGNPEAMKSIIKCS